MSTAAARYFRVDLRQWPEVCALGLLPALVYLGLSAGRMGKTPLTKWGALALSKYMGIPRARVREAVHALERAGLVQPVSALVRRLVESEAPEYAWLPQTVVMGADAERPPVQLLRESGDVLLVRLFVDMYGRHELLDDGGLALRILVKPWDRRVILRRAAWTVVGFTEDGNLTTHLTTADPLVQPHLVPAKRHSDPADADAWWSRCHHLIRLGLLQGIPRLVESSTVDALQACSFWPWRTPHDVPAEVDVAGIAIQAAEALLGKDDEAWDRYLTWHDSAASVPLAVPTHMEHATVVTGYRLRYRPQTAQTRAWWTQVHTQGAEWVARYQTVIRDWTTEAPTAASGTGG